MGLIFALGAISGGQSLLATSEEPELGASSASSIFAEHPGLHSKNAAEYNEAMKNFLTSNPSVSAVIHRGYRYNIHTMPNGEKIMWRLKQRNDLKNDSVINLDTPTLNTARASITNPERPYINNTGATVDVITNEGDEEAVIAVPHNHGLLKGNSNPVPAKELKKADVADGTEIHIHNADGTVTTQGWGEWLSGLLGRFAAYLGSWMGR